MVDLPTKRLSSNNNTLQLLERWQQQLCLLLLHHDLGFLSIPLLFILAARLRSKGGLSPFVGASGRANPVGLLALQQGAAHLFQNGASLLLKSASSNHAFHINFLQPQALTGSPVFNLKPMTVL